MAEKTRDTEDQLLASMLRAEPIDDAGFSDRIIRRIRRGIWLRRLTLPVALLLGGAIAIKSVLQLGSVVATVSNAVPGVSIAIPEAMQAQLPIAFAIGCLILISVMVFRLSEE